MPYPNQHAARVKNPDLFQDDSFRTKSIKDGITIIIGKLKGQDTMTTQAYRFEKDKYTVEEAKEWLKDNDIKYISFEKASETQAFEQKINLQMIPLQAFSNVDILALIPNETLEEIKQKDPRPYFQAYSLCHEGVSSPTIIGEGAQPISWGRKAIESIKNVIKKGVKFFLGHNEDNSIEGRRSIGEVVAFGEKIIKDKLHSIVIGYFPDKEEVKDKDICSQESIWDFIEMGKNLIADKMRELTGIALSNSKFDKPAFENAKRLGFIQAFSDISEGDSQKNNVGETKMTYEEIYKAADLKIVKQLIEDLQLHPNQLFNLEGIQEDRIFGNVFKENNDLKSKVENLEKEKTDLTRKNQLTTAKDRISQYLKDIKLGDNLQKFIENSFDKNKDKLEDITDEGLRAFVENQKEIFQDVSGYVAVNNDNVPLKSGDDIKGDDITKAANNELLDEDYNGG